ncbi:MAG: dienelactone hydrolase family protein [Candidatus Thiodiazotropha sp. (ex Troendleina suluensis)]|nr:dienelactone hydrolase family protein [Candidatus Thiodiazotropha sp. (ex Troendleina suluensis)]MCU7872369.1 dienelactone hydrolase family protein [Candidatus Thiodiazotropha sp. (ex Lucinoma borealis)]
MNRLLMIFFMCCLPLITHGAVIGEPVVYRQGETQMKGYLAYDDAVQDKRPGILVVHEWWGHNDYARSRAEQLAGMGFTALAVDMYGDGKQADHPKDAGRFAGEVKKNMDSAAARFEAAMKLLQSHKTVAQDEISAIGYCFGGGIVLEMARRGLDLDLVGSFHGSLPTSSPAAKGVVKAEVLVFNGADDPFVKAEHIEAFMSEMDQAEVKYSFTNYPGAKHSFTNPGADKFGEAFELPLQYNRAADEQSWDVLSKALKAIYGE